MLEKIVKSAFVKPLSLFLAVSFLSLSFQVSATPVKLNAGTSIPLETVSTIRSSGLTTGQVIDFRVRGDVRVGDKVVIKAGTLAKGQVVRTKSSGVFGAPAAIEIQIKSVIAADGQEVFLSGGNINQEGESKLVLSLVLTLFICPLCLFIKGGAVEVPSGTSIISAVATEIVVNI